MSQLKTLRWGSWIARGPQQASWLGKQMADQLQFWQMCSNAQIGHNNIQHNYTMENQQLITTEEQRDLGITITKDLKWQKQTKKSCMTANRVLAYIAHNFNSKSKKLFLPLCKSLVRPHLEFAVQVWLPHLRRDIDKTKIVQRKATKMIPENRNHSYQQRLKDLELISLVQSRLRWQLIEVFKCLKRFNIVSPIIISKSKKKNI